MSLRAQKCYLASLVSTTNVEHELGSEERLRVRPTFRAAGAQQRGVAVIGMSCRLPGSIEGLAVELCKIYREHYRAFIALLFVKYLTCADYVYYSFSFGSNEIPHPKTKTLCRLILIFAK